MANNTTRSMRRQIAWAFFTCLASAFAGCAAIQSHGPASKMVTSTKVAAQGLSYYLPMRLARVTFERYEVEKDAVKTRDAKAVELKKAKSALEDATTAVEDAVQYRDALKKLAVAPVKEIDKAEAKVASARVAQTAVQRNADDATAALTKAEAAVLAAARADKLCSFADRFSISLLPAVADPTKRYVIDPKHLWTRKDKLVLKTTKAGLLSTVTSTVVDQTAEILVSLASGRAALGASRVPSNIRRMGPEAAKADDGVCKVDGKPRVLPIKVEEVLNPADPQALERFSRQVSREAAVGPQSQLLALFDSTYTLIPQPLFKNPGTLPIGSPRDVGPGIAYRRELPMLVNAFVKSEDKPEPDLLGSWMLEIPNESPVELLPARASLFVQSDLNVEFDNGIPVAYDGTRPSEVARLAALPLEYAKAILEIPASIFQLRVNVGTQQNALTTVGTDAITAEIARLEALKKLADAQKASEPAKAEEPSEEPSGE